MAEAGIPTIRPLTPAYREAVNSPMAVFRDISHYTPEYEERLAAELMR